ncbi:MAG: DUF951 domain-containing protein [Clostridia bacterium]|nr:DUF951 domain-containing protein [Clostridia bacterium]
MIVKFAAGDELELKKAHPCGGRVFSVLYAASDVKIRCVCCDREVVLPRVKLEKQIRAVLENKQ